MANGNDLDPYTHEDLKEYKDLVRSLEATGYGGKMMKLMKRAGCALHHLLEKVEELEDGLDRRRRRRK